MLKDCVINPVPASQVVNVSPLEWGILTPLECTNLIPTLQQIIDSINSISEFTLDSDCINFESNSLEDTLKGFNSKINEFCETLDSISNQEVEENVFQISLCLTDNFSCTTDPCISISSCQEQYTNEELIQALSSRIVGLSTLIKEHCSKIEELEDRIEELENNDDCCDLSNINAQIANIQSQLTNINNNCC